MTTKDIQAALKRLPDKPGVYRFYDSGNRLIYVGKAKSLKSRVKSYFQKNADHGPKVAVMVEKIAGLNYIVTDTDTEALLVETNLIKTHKPKYNILMRDDKKYPWIGISAEPFPRLFITRTPETDGGRRKRKARFFGPYTSSRDMHDILHVLRKHFPMRQRKKPLFQNRPCMNYDIGACPGPCQNLVSEAEYEETVRQVELFLKGKNDDLADLLEAEMNRASGNMQFERAAKIRDRLSAVRRIQGGQKTFYGDPSISQDVVAFAADETRAVMQVLTLRRGKLIDSRSHEAKLTAGASAREAYNAFLSQYYLEQETEDLPKELVLQIELGGGADEDIFRHWLDERKIGVTLPQRGTKLELLELAERNAREALERSREYDADRVRNDPTPVLLELQDVLDLPGYPARIECYDISHVQGAQTVASMVVFTDGKPDKKHYKRFKIRSAEGRPDDFKSMAEVILRRFRHAGEPGWGDPDLVVIDGGKGQLGAAVEALEALGMTEQPIVSLAKKFEEVYKPGRARPILLPRDARSLFLLQQIRDEAHRFAITYHRQLRGKASKASALDEIPGVGEKTRQRLLAHFGSVAKIREADPDTLSRVPGINRKQAQQVFEALRKH